MDGAILTQSCALAIAEDQDVEDMGNKTPPSKIDV